MSISITVDASDYYYMTARLKAAIPGVSQAAMKAMGEKVKILAQKYATPHSGDGRLASTIKYEIRPAAGGEYGGKVYTRDPVAEIVEKGRGAGRGGMPPVDQIDDWASRHGIPAEAVFPIARKIQRSGTKGLYYMQRAGEDAQALTAEAAIEIRNGILASVSAGRLRNIL